MGRIEIDLKNSDGETINCVTNQLSYSILGHGLMMALQRFCNGKFLELGHLFPEMKKSEVSLHWTPKTSIRRQTFSFVHGMKYEFI